MNFDSVLAELGAALELPQPPPASSGQAAFDIDGVGSFRIVEVGERVLLVLSRPRLHQNMPSNEKLLAGTHFSTGPAQMLFPLELKDASVIGLGASLDSREATAPVLRQTLEHLVESLDQIFQNR